MAPRRRLNAKLSAPARRVTLVTSLMMIAFYAVAGLWWSLAGVALVLVVTFTGVAVLGHRPRASLAVHVSLASVLVGVALAVLTEAPHTNIAMTWALPVPFVAVMLGGRRAGVVWAVLTVLAMGVMTALVPLELLPQAPVPWGSWFQTIRFAALLVVFVTFAMTYRVTTEQLVDEAHRANEAKTHFLANISHEIRTPLNGVLGMTEVMLIDEERPERREQLGLILRSGHLLRALIDDLLDLTKAEREITLEQTAFNLKAVFDDAVGLAQSQAGGKLTVSMRFETTRTTVLGDPLRVRQVIGNLLANAVKFTPEGTVQLIARVDEATGWWHLSVEDTGIGMRPEVVRGLFVPFQQGDPSIARKFGGTGLGLALVHALVSKMGGRIDVESEPGRGSRFTVHVRLPEAKLEKPGSDAAAPVVSAGRKLRALVADDNVINQLITRALLESIGCEVVTAADGEEAVTKASQPFDIIFMDSQMPRVDGLEATRRIRRQGPNQQTPIIALTASAMAADIEETLGAGMNAVLPKPITRAAIVETLTRFSRKTGERSAL